MYRPSLITSSHEFVPQPQLIASSFVGRGKAVAEEETSKNHHADHGAKAEQPQPVSTQLSTHVVKVNAVVGGFGWADVAVASEEGSSPHGGGGFVAFVQGEIELVPAIFNAGI